MICPPISPHFPPIFMIIPPFIWGGEPKMDGGGNFPPKCCPPHFSRPWGGNILCPPIGIFMGGLFFHGGKLQMGGKRHLWFSAVQNAFLKCFSAAGAKIFQVWKRIIQISGVKVFLNRGGGEGKSRRRREIFLGPRQ